ncbi:MAG: 4-(cytidine 5'-diphospho)-2-C-methyl-D-erythritol kinase [Coriobacteriales bacterium]|jgi:4-diphosphocytidyl-2-C-methyl-D-erythritol kinase|nr:4-(cytidine 5'-diphospho)-2-C-methyl-D-erythritol kinase [Coriobacteriales bacterium]
MTQAAPRVVLTESAPAKLNLLLAVEPEIVGGKHRLTSVFTTISLTDTLTVVYDKNEPRAAAIDLRCEPGLEPVALPMEDNIVYRALRAFERAKGSLLQGSFAVRLDKRIPAEGGLGGGSTDAAAMLRVLTALFGCEAEVLQQIARSLGADVNFFLQSGCALMGGDGSEFIRSLALPELQLVLVKPEGGVSTAAAYAAFDADPQPAPAVAPLEALLQASAAAPVEPNTIAQIAELFTNNLYPAACALKPELADLAANLQEQPGVLKALLAGSGSVVFGVCADAATAARVAQSFTAQGYWAKAAISGYNGHMTV